MEKYKTIILIEKIRKCLEEGRPQEALAIAEGIDKKKLKNMSDLSVVAESYFQNVKYEEAKNLYIRIYQKTPSRRIVAQLVHLSIKLNDIEESKRYLKEFIKIAPKDFYQYIFRYSIDKMTKAPLVQLIEDLVELKHAEYIESWAYELAKLYHKAGMKDECLAECDDIILWFGSGEYVERAKALRAYYRGEIQIDEEDIVTNTEEAEAIFEDDKKEDIVTTVENFKNYTESNLHSNNYDNTDDVSEEVLEVENEECIHENMEINLEGDLEGDSERDFEEDLERDHERDFEGDLEGDLERDFDKNLKKDIEEADIEDKDVEESDFNIISNFDDEDFSNLENNLAEQLELSFQEKEKLTEKEVETVAADNMVSELDDNLILEIENEFGVNLLDELSEDLQDGLSEDLQDELSEELQDGPKDELQDEVNEELQDVTNPVYEEDTDSSDVRPSDVAAAHALQNTEIEREVKAEIKRLLKEVDFNELAATMELATKDEALDEVKDETKEVTKDVAKDETNDVTKETQEAKNHLSKKQKKINLETLANEQLIGEDEEDLLVQLTKNQVSLIDIFGNFMRMEAVRKQLVSSMDQILNQRSKNVIITGESQSGKTRLAKSYAKWLHRMQLIQSTKIALVNAEKLNHMNLLARKEQLKDCVIIIENAGVIAKETMKALLELSELYQDNIAIILEDSRENMNHLLRGNSQLNTIFNNRVHLHKYTLEDFMGFAYEYITEHDYEIEMDAFIELQNEFSVIMQKQRENTLQVIFSLLKDIIKKSEKRSSEQLKELSQTGHFADTELMVIKKVDIKS